MSDYNTCIIPAGSVGFAETSYEVGEEDGEVYICLEISFSPTIYLECDVNVSLTTANGTKTGISRLTIESITL